MGKYKTSITMQQHLHDFTHTHIYMFVFVYAWTLNLFLFVLTSHETTNCWHFVSNRILNKWISPFCKVNLYYLEFCWNVFVHLLAIYTSSKTIFRWDCKESLFLHCRTEEYTEREGKQKLNTLKSKQQQQKTQTKPTIDISPNEK